MFKKVKAGLSRSNPTRILGRTSLNSLTLRSKARGGVSRDTYAFARLITLPIELLQHIIFFLDWDTLQSFSLLNHYLHNASNHRLWSRIRINDRDSSPLHEYTSPTFIVRKTCEAITRDPQRASCIKGLAISLSSGRLGDYPTFQNGEDEALWEGVLLRVGDTLSLMPRLQVLDLSRTISEVLSASLCRTIVNQHIRHPFSLREIVLHDRTRPFFMPLLHCWRSTLVCFSVLYGAPRVGDRSAYDPALLSMATGIMPNLEVFYGKWEVARQICRGRKLRTVRTNLNQNESTFRRKLALSGFKGRGSVSVNGIGLPTVTNVHDEAPLGEAQELVLIFPSQLAMNLNRGIEAVLGVSCACITQLQLRTTGQMDTNLNSPFYTIVLPAFIVLANLQFVFPVPDGHPAFDKSKAVVVASVCASAVESLGCTSISRCLDDTQFHDLSMSHGFSSDSGVVFRRVSRGDGTDLETAGRNYPLESFTDTRGFDWVMDNWAASAVNGL